MTENRKESGGRHTERVPITCTKDWLARVDDWRFTNRVGSRAMAIRKLAERGLTVDQDASNPDPQRELAA